MVFAWFVRNQAWTNQQKNKTNHKKIKAKFECEKNLPKLLKNRFGRVLGSIWEAFGMVLGVSWPLLGASWALCAPPKFHFFKALVQDGLQEAFGIDFRSILGGFSRDLGGILEGFTQFWADWGLILDTSGETQPCWSRFSTWTPALLREASQ